MTYLEQATNAYRDSMLEMGVSEDVINFALFGFESGFIAGSLQKDDITLQQKMVETLLNKN